MDRINKNQRRKNMQAVKSKGSEIETLLSKALWNKGYRFRKNVNIVFGKPDICIKKYKVAIFVDSEFWHGKNWELRKHDHKSNVDFWLQKIERNIQRDKEVNEYLKENGWKVLRFWGKDIKTDLVSCIKRIEEEINEIKNKNFN